MPHSAPDLTSPAGPTDTAGAARALKTEILDLVRRFDAARAPGPFAAGESPVLSSGAVFGADDRVALVEAALEMRIAAGVSSTRFERLLARTVGVRKAHLTNSGSSANLLAVSALCSSDRGERRLRPGDEVITVAAGFPTTVNPLIQNQLVPVFVDVELGTYNTTPERVLAAIGPRTRAIVIAHALGNPYPVAEIAQIAADHGLFLVEDNCDALGATYRGRPTGSYGDLATVSFYPAHHITTGEGGCVLTDSVTMARTVEQLRDWGRDCWCEPGKDDTCQKRFDYQLGDLPHGYDHKYTFSQVGYNLKSTDLQAALGLQQLTRLEQFGEARRHNWNRLRAALDGTPGLLLPEPTPDSVPSWFGFVLTVSPEARYSRQDLVAFLEARRIGTRRFFGGNLTRHPAYAGREFRISGELTHSDVITENTFWVGVYPGITDEMTDYIAASVHEFVGASPTYSRPAALIGA